MANGLIFDLDGLLADTESIHYEAYREVLLEQGINITKGMFIDNWTKNGRGIKEFLIQINSTADADFIREEKAQLFDAMAKYRLKEMQGATSLLSRCCNTYKMALATSSRKCAADMVLGHLKMKRYFDVILTRDDIYYPKPNPEIFIKASEIMGLNRRECIVVEDSPKGICAAIAAGMTAIAIPNEYTADSSFSDATLVLQTLDDITDDLLSQI